MRQETMEQVLISLTPARLRDIILELAQPAGEAPRDSVGVAALAKRLAKDCAPDDEPFAWTWEQSLGFGAALRRALANVPGMRYVESEP